MLYLLYTSLLFLLYLEIFYEGHFGDLHDIRSSIRLTLTFLIAWFLGLIVGVRFNSLITYLFLRIGLFDPSYGKIFRTGFFYLGKKSKTDRINRRIPNTIRVSIWVLSFIISIIINFKIYEQIF